MVSKSLHVDLGWPHPISHSLVVDSNPASAVSSNFRVMLTNWSVVACRRVGLSTDAHCCSRLHSTIAMKVGVVDRLRERVRCSTLVSMITNPLMSGDTILTPRLTVVVKHCGPRCRCRYRLVACGTVRG